MPRRILIFLILLSLSVLFFHFRSERFNKTWTENDNILIPASAIGMDRMEREISFRIMPVTYDHFKKVEHSVKTALQNTLGLDSLQVPKLVQGEYAYFLSNPEAFFYDVYFDSPEFINYKSNTSARLRVRYPDIKTFKENLKNPLNPNSYGDRYEFQVKLNSGTELESTPLFYESRYLLYVNNFIRGYMKKMGKMIAEEHTPLISDFIKIIQSGKLNGQELNPTRQLMTELSRKHKIKSLSLSPSIEMRTRRIRHHIDISVPWSMYGNEAFIITIDYFTGTPLTSRFRKTENVTLARPYFIDFDIEVDPVVSFFLEMTREYLNKINCSIESENKMTSTQFESYVIEKILPLTSGEQALYRPPLIQLDKFLNLSSEPQAFQQKCSQLLAGINNIMSLFEQDQKSLLAAIKRQLSADGFQVQVKKRTNKYQTIVSEYYNTAEFP